MDKFTEIVEEINKHLECTNQNWLFGAGISYGANIPLMNCLTERVAAMLPTGEIRLLYEDVASDLPSDFHIEHVLSHLGDHIAIAERSKHKMTGINKKEYSATKLRELHSFILLAISKTVRYGYCKANTTLSTPEQIGKIDAPIVKIDSHRKFAETLLSTHANLLSRSAISIFTTNYDTLIEDAFSLINIEVNDGFIGAAIGSWRPEISYKKSSGVNVVKLHGSVDWINDQQKGLLRTRYGVNYLSDDSEVLIYPQATKYVETQKDPFAALFSEFRHKLSCPNDNVIIVCGYSFGDAHINSEIFQAINQKGNKSTLIAFVENNNEFLTRLLNAENTEKKVYVASKQGVYHGDDALISPIGVTDLEWWKFESMITFLRDGDAI